jgi:membrane dipeptidase
MTADKKQNQRKKFAELIRRGHWSERDLAGLANQNLLRVLEGAEETARKMRKEGKKPSMAVYDKRTDLGERLD